MILLLKKEREINNISFFYVIIRVGDNMNKRLKSMEYILILGAIIILVSGLSFLGSSFLNTDLLKLLVMALITRFIIWIILCHKTHFKTRNII